MLSLKCRLYDKSAFTSYSGVEIPDLSTSREVMNGFAAESREQVDEAAERAVAAGATPIGDAQDFDGLYMRAFRDLDGHWWSLNYVDMGSHSRCHTGRLTDSRGDGGLLYFAAMMAFAFSRLEVRSTVGEC